MSGSRLALTALSAALVASLTGASASAAVLAGYNFGNTSATPTLAATTADPNVVAGDLAPAATTAAANQTTTGLYTNAPVPFRAVSRTSGGSVSSGTPTPDQSGYYVQFTVTPAAGYELDLEGFSFFGAQGGGVANTRGFAIYTSVDGTALTTNSNIASGPTLSSGTFGVIRGTVANPTAMQEKGSATLLTDPRFQNLTGPFTVRVYFSSADQGQNIDVDNFVLTGTANAVPEPTTLAALAGGAIALIGRRRRA